MARKSYEWAGSEGHKAEMVAQVVDTAHDLAKRCLSVGDLDGATWAARAGLRACPYEERLYCDLMEAAAAAGNATRLEGAMDELLARQGSDPVGEPHPDTVALYESLRRQCRRPS